MINKDRIVPVVKTDLLTLYGTVLKIANVSYSVLDSADIEGNFTAANTGTYIANQPVKSLNFTAASGTVYFVAANDYEGFKVSGTAAETELVPVGDCATLYKAVLDTGVVTVTAVSPNV